MKKFLMYGLVVMILGTTFASPISHAQSNAAPVLTQTLSLGSIGNEVSLLQQFLKDKGYFFYKTITARFGLKTKSAVIAFQKDNTLTPDGVVGPLTRAKIAELPLVKKEGNSLSTSSTTTWSESRRYGGNIIIPDTTAPAVSVTAPANSDTVSGSSVNISASASDDTAVAGVQFKVDGSAVGSEDITAPYEIEWDSTSASDGAHSITAVARDTAGNSTESAAISVDVSNSYLLVVNAAGAGMGTVTSVPSGIACGGGAVACTHLFPTGLITLSATPAPGSTFVGWSGGGCSGTGTCVVTLTSVTSVTATFNLVTYALTVSNAGGGSGVVTSTPSGINCGATCSTIYSSGTVVSLTATPQVDSIFSGWTGGGCAGTGTCSVTMTAVTSVTATFDPI